MFIEQKVHFQPELIPAFHHPLHPPAQTQMYIWYVSLFYNKHFEACQILLSKVRKVHTLHSCVKGLYKECHQKYTLCVKLHNVSKSTHCV